jgi:tRNA1Val (adenine37-N6)-methyltransferase
MSKFSFKKFSIEQDRCAMKIGTDVFTWCVGPIENPFSIFDIGTGSGCLNVAQRNAGQIDALEIDQAAYEQAVDNFENSLD